jgi:hypothetical protein
MYKVLGKPAAELRPMGFWGGVFWGTVIGAAGTALLAGYLLYQTGALQLLFMPPATRLQMLAQMGGRK